MKRRSNMAPQRYAPTRTGVLAVDPSAFLELFIVPSSRESELIGDVCVVDICGPLEQHDVGWSDSYEAIRGRVAEACASAAAAIVLRIDSPGGACAGCFDAARAIRSMCAQAGKPLYAYCDHATSAGYALACAASGICASDTAMIGSIGVIETRHDFSAQNAAAGVRVEFIASGARKVDGRVDAPITDAEIVSKRRNVDAVAGLFFALVEETRGIAAADIRALEADVYHAEAARGAGLIDDVTTFEAMLARIASGERIAMATPYEDARAALEKAAKGDDHNAAAAKRALAAMNENMGGDDDADGDGEKPPAKKPAEGDAAEGDDDDKDAAEGDDDKSAEGGDDDKSAAEGDDDDAAPPAKKPAAAAAGAGATASTRTVALEALAQAHNARAELRDMREHDERVRLLDTRKDFSRELRAELMRASTPIATVRNMVKNLKRGTVSPTGKPAAGAGVAASAAPTRGAGQGDAQTGGSAPLSADAVDMDLRMGLVDTTLGVTKNRNTLLFGVVHKPQAAPAAPAAAGARGSK